MELDIQTVLIFLSLGAFVGYMAGLFGLGGGGFLVPAFVAIFSLHGISEEKIMHMALATSMMSIVITSFASFQAHNKRGSVNWSIFKKMLPGVVLGTFAATFVAVNIKSYYLALFFTIVMIILSIRMIFDMQPKKGTAVPNRSKLFSAGSIIGAISAIMSVGGGAFTVPYLTSHNIDIKKAIGTSAAIGFPLSLVGTLGYVLNGWGDSSLSNLQLGYVYLPAVILVSLTSTITAPLGVKTAHMLPTAILKKFFAFLLIGLSIKMLISFI